MVHMTTFPAVAIASLLMLSNCTYQCEENNACPAPFDVTLWCGTAGDCTTSDGPATCDSTCKLAPGQVLFVPIAEFSADLDTRKALAVRYTGYTPPGIPDEKNAHVLLAGVEGTPIELDPKDLGAHFVWDNFSADGDLAFSYTDGARPADRLQLYFVDLPCAVTHPEEPCEQ
jgi:hypothetical protein